jgi:hypothetical protein
MGTSVSRSAGGESDAALGEGEAGAVGSDGHRPADVLEVVERLTHAHQHDVGDLAFARRHQAAILRWGRAWPVADRVAGDKNLGDDLLWSQIAHQALGAGVAERAGQGAADLTRDAQRAAVGLGNKHGLDLRRPGIVPAPLQPQEPFASAVGGDLGGSDLGPRQGVGAGEGGAQVLGNVRHLLERAGAAHVQPAPQLAQAHLQLLLGDADGGQRRRKPLAAETGQRRLGGGRRLGVAEVGGDIHGIRAARLRLAEIRPLCSE